MTKVPQNGPELPNPFSSTLKPTAKSIHVLRPCHTVQFFLQIATQLATLDVKLANHGHLSITVHATSVKIGMLSIHVLRPCHTVQFFLQLATQLATLDVKLANTPFHHSLLIYS